MYLGQVPEEFSYLQDGHQDDQGCDDAGYLRGRRTECEVSPTPLTVHLAPGPAPRREAALPRPTWLLPPVLSCTRLRDMEQLMAKHWKKPPRKLQKPSAISSCRDRAEVGEHRAFPSLKKYELFHPGKGPCTSEHHLVAVHFVAVLQGKDLAQGDADGVAHHGNGERVAHHLPKVAEVRDHGRLQPTAKTGRWG